MTHITANVYYESGKYTTKSFFQHKIVIPTKIIIATKNHHFLKKSPFSNFSGDSSVSKCSRNIDLNDYQCNPNNTLSSPITGTDCCCALNNENEQSAWGNSCTLCPAPNSHEHQKLCSNIGPIDYCKVVKENPCGTGGKCENVHQKKTFQCKCSPGFKETDDKHDCIDVDECKLNYCKGRTNKCTNTVGSYRCGCGNGYRAVFL